MGVIKQLMLKQDEEAWAQQLSKHDEPQPEEFYPCEPHEDTEMIIVDSTTDGLEEEFRLVRIDGFFYLESWDNSKSKWIIHGTFHPRELLNKIKA